MDQTALFSMPDEDPIINAPYEPSGPALSSALMQQFMSFLASRHVASNPVPYPEVPDRGCAPQCGGTNTTGITNTLSPHVIYTRGAHEPMGAVLHSGQQFVEPCATDSSWGVPASDCAPLDIPLQETAAMLPSKHEEQPSRDSIQKLPRQSPSPSPIYTRRVFRCKWQGCDGSHYFKREGDLVRHLRTIHISPGSYPCHAEGCTKVFGRRDHLCQHTKRRHASAKP
ncbi:uncharacterized protein DSM5745_08588 [Aspergillus mulundensis]|uniref:C2H2-type domain-containing protein n=1 Tax=Aspergillus mulundensis TaxID=1810919 RepID=A0A3D8R4D5_9EURO|nr:hypothetical protein DSM5745_08588 [Aspergillus mulundensis]RDW68828.1 hypothetical protein DSM5745_08588 [Aspergillus mulundensis]